MLIVIKKTTTNNEKYSRKQRKTRDTRDTIDTRALSIKHTWSE